MHWLFSSLKVHVTWNLTLARSQIEISYAVTYFITSMFIALFVVFWSKKMLQSSANKAYLQVSRCLFQRQCLLQGSLRQKFSSENLASRRLKNILDPCIITVDIVTHLLQLKIFQLLQIVVKLAWWKYPSSHLEKQINREVSLEKSKM